MHEFNSNNFIFNALSVLEKRSSFKTPSKIEFLGPFYGLKKNPPVNLASPEEAVLAAGLY